MTALYSKTAPVALRNKGRWSQRRSKTLGLRLVHLEKDPCVPVRTGSRQSQTPRDTTRLSAPKSLKNASKISRQVFSVEATASTDKAFSQTNFLNAGKNPDSLSLLFTEMTHRGPTGGIWNVPFHQRSGPKTSPKYRGAFR
jgi:hypothetical protein